MSQCESAVAAFGQHRVSLSDAQTSCWNSCEEGSWIADV